MVNKILLLCATVFWSFALFAQSEGDQLPKWQEGYFDIHHISTGRGDATFLVLPDGTTMLIDAGDMSETHSRTLSSRNTPLWPNRTKTTGQWIADYIRQFTPDNSSSVIDYAIITHYHDDHFGEIDSMRNVHQSGGYQLTGITEVGSLIPIATMNDRGDDFPLDLKDNEIQARLTKGDAYQMIGTLQNYWKFIDYQKRTSGLHYETLAPGTHNQLVLTRSPEKYGDFCIRNIAVNGKIWTGEGESYYSLFSSGQYPGENSLSTCLKFSYGLFDYFTGGDINGVDQFGHSDFDRVESHVAPVIGPVDVATLNHHGNRDSQNTFYVRTLRPRVWIGQTWSSDHPDNNVLRRLLSEDLYPGDRDLFSTAMLQANREVIGSLLDRYKSQQGHIVVRVAPKGGRYSIFVLNCESEKREIIGTYGPYNSR
jgi:beta-lactamase superfamily II metal-dependent hydrolase